jgi:hypothetical protein
MAQTGGSPSHQFLVRYQIIADVITLQTCRLLMGGATACNAVANDAPPADSRISPNSPCGSSMPTTTSVAPNSRSLAARSGRPATAVPQRAQRGQAGDRQRGCSGKLTNSIGQYGDALRRHRGAFGPAVLIHQRDNACPADGPLPSAARRNTMPLMSWPGIRAGIGSGHGAHLQHRRVKGVAHSRPSPYREVQLV